MRITEVDKGLTQSELDQLEVFADRLFAKVGIDVEFTRHFLDRVNDERNVKQITASELTRLFKQEYKRWGKPIAQMGPDAEAVLKDLATDVNIPFALRWDKENNELDLIAKTVMRKKNFKTSNKEFEIQSADYSLDNIQHKKVFESIKQLNEAGPAAVAVPIGIAAWNAYVYSRYAQAAWFTAKFTATTAAAYIVANKSDFSWLERKMASSAILAYQLWDKVRGVQDMSSVQWRDTNASAMASGQAGAENPLGPRPTADMDGDPYGIINARQQVAAGQLGAQARLDLALADLAADQKAWDIESNKNQDKDASSGAMASGQAGATLTKLTLDASQQLNGELAAGVNELTANANIETEIDSEKTDAIAIATANAQNLVSDNNLIKLATTITQAKQNDDSDAKLISLATKIATAQQAADKVTAQNTASDAKLIALGQQVAQQQADKLATELSDKKLIALGQQVAQQQADIKATELSDAKLIALGQQVAQQKAIAAANAISDAKLIALGQQVAQQQATAQNTASDAKLIALGQQVAQQKIDTQNATSDAKLIALGQQVAQSQADAKATAQNTASDANLIALGQAYADAKADAKADAQNKASDAKLIALAQAVSTVNDVELNVPDKVIGQNDINIGDIGKDIDITIPGAITGAGTTTGAPTGVDIHPGTTDATAQGNAAAAAAAALAGAKIGANAQSTTADPNGNNRNNNKKSKKKFDWGLGDGDYWDTNLYKWTQKYGTFENKNLIKKYFMINEGGAMPGVGAIHIDEITPTLQALEKSIGVDLMNNTLGSVGKRQFSGDIDVALQIQPEELPAFIEELKKNPLVLDIAKSSVIMTKVKIMDFDQSKSDGRPRTGFVQVDFMPGDPGWMKTYYHSPSEEESKYKGVYRNIMIATLAAVHNRDQSDAKLDDGRAMEERRFMWSPTEGLLRVQRTPVPKKNGDGYTKKNKNETIDGPWKQPDEIAAQLGLDSGKDLNSFESLWTAVKKNWTKEKLQYVIDGFKQNNVVQDIGVPEELDDVN